MAQPEVQTGLGDAEHDAEASDIQTGLERSDERHDAEASEIQTGLERSEEKHDAEASEMQKGLEEPEVSQTQTGFHETELNTTVSPVLFGIL